MAFKRYYPTKDTTIANYDPGIVGTKDISYSNVGASEILSTHRALITMAVFDSFGAFSESLPFEAQAKSLLAFPSFSLPPSASVSLKLFNAQHAETVPVGCNILVRPVEQVWAEGIGHDFDYYTDAGVANWHMATITDPWQPLTGSTFDEFYLEDGNEDVSIDVSGWVIPNGVEISIYETGSDLYVKKFHGRATHFPTKRPYLDVRWTDWTGSLTTDTVKIGNSGSYSGTIIPDWSSIPADSVQITRSIVDPTGTVIASMGNLKNVYDAHETSVLQVKVLTKDWNPSTVVRFPAEAPGTVLMDMYYQIVSEGTEEVVVPYDTGSLKSTKLSYNDFYNYFTINMDSLPPETLMRFEFMYQVNGIWTVIPGNEFKFRVK